jgi:hypothetical protein
MKTILLTIATMSCISLTAQVTEPIKPQEGTVTIDIDSSCSAPASIGYNKELSP